MPGIPPAPIPLQPGSGLRAQIAAYQPHPGAPLPPPQQPGEAQQRAAMLSAFQPRPGV